MVKELNKELCGELLKVSERCFLSNEDLLSIIDELQYIARDNGYSDDMLCQISEILSQ